MRHINSLLIALLIALLIVTALGIAQPTQSARAAATITVTNPEDNTTTGNGCSLREAITNANNNAATYPDCAAGSGNDTIVFSSGIGTATVTLASPLPVITDANGLTINGAGDKITINGNHVGSVFVVATSVAPAPLIPFTLQNLIIANGFGIGGGVYNPGILTILATTFENNDGLTPGQGGAIYNNSGTVTITNSTFMGNTAASGGTIYNDGGAVTITNSTITGSTATNGGVLYNQFGVITLTNSTIYTNSLTAVGSAIVYNNGNLTATNTILADGAGAPLCAGNSFAVASAKNLADDTTCGTSFTQKTIAELALTTLADHGGPTPTFGLGAGSAAEDAGTNTGCPATDQRGITRPQGQYCDVGSFEIKKSLTFNPTSFVFPNQLAGTTSNPVHVVVTNTSEVGVTLGILAIAGEFALVANTCDLQTLLPTETCSFDINFTPHSAALKTGAVTIPSTVSATAISYALSGTGVAAVQLLKLGGFDSIVVPIPWRTLVPIRNLNSVRECFGYYLSPPCSVRLTGKSLTPTTTVQYTIQQLVVKTGVAGDKYYFGMSSRANNIPTGGKYQVDILFYDLYNRVVGSQSLYFSIGTHDFETLAAYYTVPAAYYRILFRFTLQKSSGTAWFDNAILTRAP